MMILYMIKSNNIILYYVAKVCEYSNCVAI